MTVADEFSRRFDLWKQISAGDAANAEPNTLRSMRVYGGAGGCVLKTDQISDKMPQASELRAGLWVVYSRLRHARSEGGEGVAGGVGGVRTPHSGPLIQAVSIFMVKVQH
jgi:hypothetical protein